VLPQISKLKGAALDLFFPQKCLGCGREGELLCYSCQSKIPRISMPLCPRCGKPQINDIVCPSCVSHKTDLDGIRAPFKFEGVIREAIHQLKYKNLRSIATTIAAYLYDYSTSASIPAEVLVPVPLHIKRLKERGYNQSELIAKELGSRLNLPVECNSLIRNKYILPQAKTQSIEERRKNVIQSFTCQSCALQGKKVLLIDDVYTSGATLEACASAIKTVKPVSIWGLVAAREI
jgi:ComF family protein